MTAQTTGTHGEALAQRHLQANGYTLVATNWRCLQGELDIVARQGETLVFVEVRTRHSTTTEHAFASIDPRKRQKLLNTVHHYLAEHYTDEPVWRIDVIAIALRKNQPPLIEQVEDALDW